MNISTLENTAIEIVHEAFVKAFFDYEVQIPMPLDKFKEMIKTRDLNLAYSLGYFDQDKLVGFIISGYREYNGFKYCYDGGTGIIKDFRRKGIGNKLLQELLIILRDKNISKFVLEVLENNSPAIELYKKQGFEITRKFNCYEINKQEISSEKEISRTISNDIAQYASLDSDLYMTFKPSWQNDKKSIVNVLDRYEYASIIENNTVIGFGFIHKERGDIPQIGILEEWRNKNIEKLLINILKEKTVGNRITFLNIEENNYLGKELEKIGFKNFINQYEMILELNSGGETCIT